MKLKYNENFISMLTAEEVFSNLEESILFEVILKVSTRLMKS